MDNFKISEVNNSYIIAYPCGGFLNQHTFKTRKDAEVAEDISLKIRKAINLIEKLSGIKES